MINFAIGLVAKLVEHDAKEAEPSPEPVLRTCRRGEAGGAEGEAAGARPRSRSPTPSPEPVRCTPSAAAGASASSARPAGGGGAEGGGAQSAGASMSSARSAGWGFSRQAGASTSSARPAGGAEGGEARSVPFGAAAAPTSSTQPAGPYRAPPHTEARHSALDPPHRPDGPDRLPSSMRTQSADALPAHNHADRGRASRQEVLDAFARHTMGGGGFADSGLTVGPPPPLRTDGQTRGKHRLLSIEQLGAGIQHVQSQINTATLREVSGEVPGWEDDEHDEEGNCEDTAALGRGQPAEEDELPPIPRGCMGGSKGFALVIAHLRKNLPRGATLAPLMQGWRVQVVYWNRMGEPRWHNACVLEVIGNVLDQPSAKAHMFYEQDRYDEWLDVEERTIAWKKPGTKDVQVTAGELKQWRAFVTQRGDDSD